MTSYVIQFQNGIEVPDLSKNQRLLEVARIQSKHDTGYLVSSKINDTNLRQLIMENMT